MVSTTFVLRREAFPHHSGAVLEGAIVRVFSQDGETFVTQGQTDASGEVVFELSDSTTYWVRFFKPEYAFPTRLLVEVDSSESSNTFDVEGTYLLEHPPSANPYLCRASGYVRGADWSPKAGVGMTFMLTGKPRIVAGQVMVASDVIARSDKEGWIEVELVRNGSYDVLVPDLGDEPPIRVQVPDRESVSITELLWPYVAELTYTPSSVEVAVGESVDVRLTATLSSGVTTPFTRDDEGPVLAGYYLRFSNSNADVASAEWHLGDDDQDYLTVEGRLPGTTRISAEVRPDREADREPDPTRSLPDLLITVTE